MAKPFNPRGRMRIVPAHLHPSEKQPRGPGGMWRAAGDGPQAAVVTLTRQQARYSARQAAKSASQAGAAKKEGGSK